MRALANCCTRLLPQTHTQPVICRLDRPCSSHKVCRTRCVTCARWKQTSGRAQARRSAAAAAALPPRSPLCIANTSGLTSAGPPAAVTAAGPAGGQLLYHSRSRSRLQQIDSFTTHEAEPCSGRSPLAKTHAAGSHSWWVANHPALMTFSCVRLAVPFGQHVKPAVRQAPA